MARNEVAQRNVSAVKRINIGRMPLFVQLAHQGFTKSVPDGVKVESGDTTFIVPLDLMRMVFTDETVLAGVDHIEMAYHK